MEFHCWWSAHSATVFREEIVEEPPWEVFDEDGLSRLLRRQDGVITTRQALGYLSEKAIRHRVRSGRWRRVHRGVLLAQTGWVSETQRLWIAVLATGSDRSALVGGRTALTVRGLRGVRADDIHVLVPRAKRVVVPAGVTLHRVSYLPPQDCDRSTSPPSTAAGRSVVDAAQWARSDEEARLVIAASFQQRLVRMVDVDRALERMLNARRRALILRTAWDCAGGSESLGELDFLALCRRAGLPLPSRQVQRRDRFGRRRYLDAFFDEWRIVVEIDGAHHMAVEQMWDDAGRQNDLELAGYLVLRYPAFVVRRHPERVIADLRMALIGAGWTPR